MFSADALKRSADRLSDRSLSFRLDTAGGVPEGLIEVGVSSIAVSPPGLKDADLTGLNVLVDTPLLEFADTLMPPAGEGRLTLTVDHFVHVERLLEVDWPSPPRVLVEVSFGHKRFGCRPGREAIDLATVIDRSDRLTLAGLAATVTTPGMAEAALQCREQMEGEGLAAETISLATAEESVDVIPAGQPGLEVRHAAPSAITGVRTTILGRPSLEVAAVDFGTAHGVASKKTLPATLPDGAAGEVRVREAEPFRSLLDLPEPLHDATIGQPLTLTGPTPVGTNAAFGLRSVLV